MPILIWLAESLAKSILFHWLVKLIGQEKVTKFVSFIFHLCFYILPWIVIAALYWSMNPNGLTALGNGIGKNIINYLLVPNNQNQALSAFTLHVLYCTVLVLFIAFYILYRKEFLKKMVKLFFKLFTLYSLFIYITVKFSLLNYSHSFNQQLNRIFNHYM